jgi:DNA modification methylase
MDMEGCELIEGDCLSVMRGMPTATVDAIVADPPAGISFMGKAFDSDRGGRASWVAWLAERMAEAARVVKPGHYGRSGIWGLMRAECEPVMTWGGTPGKPPSD